MYMLGSKWVALLFHNVFVWAQMSCTTFSQCSYSGANELQYFFTVYFLGRKWVALPFTVCSLGSTWFEQILPDVVARQQMIHSSCWSSICLKGKHMQSYSSRVRIIYKQHLDVFVQNRRKFRLAKVWFSHSMCGGVAGGEGYGVFIIPIQRNPWLLGCLQEGAIQAAR